MKDSRSVRTFVQRVTVFGGDIQAKAAYHLQPSIQRTLS